MMKAFVMMALCFTPCTITHAAPLYQWTDANGATQLTAEVPPAGAKNIHKVFASEPPPMAQAKTPSASISNSSILMPSANSQRYSSYASSSDNYNNYSDSDSDDDDDDIDYGDSAPATYEPPPRYRGFSIGAASSSDY